MADRKHDDTRRRPPEDREKGRGEGRREYVRAYGEGERGQPERRSAERRPGPGPGEESGEGFWTELREERSRGEYDRYGDRSARTSLDHDTDRWGYGQYGLGAGAAVRPGGGEDYHRYGGDRGRTGAERGRYGYGTRGWGEVDERDAREERELRYWGPPRGEGRPSVGDGTSPTHGEDREAGHGVGRSGMQGASSYWERGPARRLGRGPRNYQRSDERIREDICDRLMQAWMDASDVEVRAQDGEVTLTGTVKTREEKRAIEDLAEEVLGVKEVHNELRLAREPPREEAQPAGRTLHS